VVAQTETGAGVLRPRWRFQRTRRSDQRTVGTPTRHRPRLPQLRPLRPALPDPLRTTHRENQSTLKPEEPKNSMRSGSAKTKNIYSVATSGQVSSAPCVLRGI